MRKHMLYLEIIILILLSGCSEKNTSQDKQTHRPNILSQEELQEGWRLLFDGETTRGWRGANMDHFPEYGWTIENGCLIVNKGGRKAGKRGGDIVTLKKYANFDLRFEFKLTPMLTAVLNTSWLNIQIMVRALLLVVNIKSSMTIIQQ